MSNNLPAQNMNDRRVKLALPFTGLWKVENSPARRVPSHGSDLFGERYAIDFVGVNENHHTATHRSWRTFFATEPPDIFYAFGQPILAPKDGTVVAVHDGEPDHEARRSQLALIPYALSQASRARQGVNALAGNYITIALSADGPYVSLAHLQARSIQVSVGEKVTLGQQIARCGNSGNSTQPHLHMQVTDSADLSYAKGIPMVFYDFREWKRNTAESKTRRYAIPNEGAVIASINEKVRT